MQKPRKKPSRVDAYPPELVSEAIQWRVQTNAQLNFSKQSIPCHNKHCPPFIEAALFRSFRSQH